MMTVVECLCTPIKVKYTIMAMGPSSHALLAASHLWHVGDKIEWESKDGGCDFYTCAHVAHGHLYQPHVHAHVHKLAPIHT